MATLKMLAELLSHYSDQWFSVQGPLCYVKPWQWLLAKFSLLPLEEARSLERRADFHIGSERIDMFFAGRRAASRAPIYTPRAGSRPGARAADTLS